MELFEAAKNGNIQRINQLLDNGVDINIKDKIGWTALMIASTYSNKHSSLETVKLLLDRGANTNIKNNEGMSALLLASVYSDIISGNISSPEAIKLLLEYGADPFVINNRGNTALDLCPTQECKQIIYKGIWNRLYQSDKTLARYYSRSGKPGVNGETPLPKDVWEIILLNKRQKELCQNMNTDEYKDVLVHFANMLYIPINDKLTKKDLCNLISKYLAYGQYDDPKRAEFIKERL